MPDYIIRILFIYQLYKKNIFLLKYLTKLWLTSKTLCLKIYFECLFLVIC